jgi:hypothetical protein
MLLSASPLLCKAHVCDGFGHQNRGLGMHRNLRLEQQDHDMKPDAAEILNDALALRRDACASVDCSFLNGPDTDTDENAEVDIGHPLNGRMAESSIADS